MTKIEWSPDRSNGLILRLTLCLILSFVMLAYTPLQSSFSDPYDTNKFYVAWIEELRGVSFDDSFVSHLYAAAFSTIKSPEPIPHLFSWFVGNSLNVIPIKILDFYSAILILALVFSLKMNRKDILVSLIFMIYICFFSYYWFILFQVTHRLKIAFIFLIFSILAKRHHKVNLSNFLLMLAIFSHLSILFTLPIFYYYQSFNLVVPNINIKKILYSSVFFIFLGVVVFSYYIETGVRANIIILIHNKIPFLSSVYSTLIILILAIIVNTVIPTKIKIFLGLQLLFASISFLGFSRVLMLIFLSLSLVILFNPKLIFSDQRKWNVTKLCVFLLLAWDLYRFSTTIILGAYI